MRKPKKRVAASPPGITLTWLGDQEELVRRLPSKKIRRRVLRSEAKMARRSTVIPATMELVPAGSILSDRTITDIQAGLYGIRLTNPPMPPTAPRLTYAQKLKRRAKANKAKRLALAGDNA